VNAHDPSPPFGNWKQTWSGRAFPMDGFTFADIDLFGDVAESLARVCRYGGHVQGPSFSVAQHCVLGSDAAIEETGDVAVAAYVLLHDAHEFIIGDITTPRARWFMSIERQLYGTSEVVRNVIVTAKQRLDEAIWRAAGLPTPTRQQRDIIKAFDIRLLATEKRQLLAASPHGWGWDVENAAPIRMRGKLAAWPAGKAADEYRARLSQLCPNARRV